ncbi:MAG: AbgT family transporter, partial [Caulobacter sp.]
MGLERAGQDGRLAGPAQDALLGITQEAARLIDPTWSYVITDNYYLIIAFTFLVTLVGWFVTDVIVEPRLGPWARSDEQ